MKKIPVLEIYTPDCTVIHLASMADFKKLVGNNSVFQFNGELHFLTEDKMLFKVTE